MAFGLLSVFLPLYVISVGGSLIDVGLMTAIGLLLAIPSSFFWGYICDKVRRYKIFILISFLAMALLLYLFTFSSGIGWLIIVYAAISIFQVAYEPPKNVLIAETYSYEEWKERFALFEGLAQAGWLAGLVIGFLTAFWGFSASYTLIVCSLLNLAAFATSLVFVRDPVLMIERGLVSIRRSVDIAYRGAIFASNAFNGKVSNERLDGESLPLFFAGLALFSLAANMLFTPLPIFLSRDLLLPTSVVFIIYMLNAGGGVAGFFTAWMESKRMEERSIIVKAVLIRGILALLLIVAAQLTIFSFWITTAILVMMGFVYAFYLTSALPISMEIIPKGKGGLFNALIGIGAASGAYIGPLLAQSFGFVPVFLFAGIISFLACICFKLFA